MRGADRRWLALLSVLGLGLTCLLWRIMAPGIAWDENGLHLTSGLDFLNYWGAPRLAQHDIHTLFAGRDYARALQQLFPQAYDEMRWSYPLHSLFFFAPFSALPYGQALLVWSALGLGLYLVMAARMVPSNVRREFAMWLVASPIVIVELLTRQNGFFIGAAAVAVLGLLQTNRPVLAGILLGCLTIKPQLFILWPLMLVMQRQWRCMIAAGLTTCALLGMSFVVHGLAAWQEWWAVVPNMQWRIISAEEFNETRKLTHLMMPGVLPALRILAAPEWLAQGVQWLTSLTVLVLCARAFSRPLPLATTLMVLASGGLLVSPYGFNYDMTLLMPALLCALLRPSRPLYERVLFGMAYLLPLLVYVFNVTDMPIAPAILALVFLHGLREARAIRHPLNAGIA